MSTDYNYNDRVSKVFQKLHVIQESVEDEKANRYKMISMLISNFQTKVDELHTKKQQKFQVVLDKLRQISDAIEDHKFRREKIAVEIEKSLANTQKNCLKILQNNKKQRIQTQRRIAFQLNSQLDLLAAEIHKRSSHEPQTAYLDVILQEDIQRLKEDLTLEINKRREVQEKIFSEFTDQLNKLKDQFQQEKADRQIRQEQIIKYIKEITYTTKQKIGKMKRERESNQVQAMNLIQNIIQKLKREMLQLRF